MQEVSVAGRGEGPLVGRIFASVRAYWKSFYLISIGLCAVGPSSAQLVVSMCRRLVGKSDYRIRKPTRPRGSRDGTACVLGFRDTYGVFHAKTAK